MRRKQLALIVSSLFVFAAGPVLADSGGAAATPQSDQAAVEKCEHGVKKTLCARCNPKLEAVFKAKGDWCAEHSVPESQCVLCHPELGKQGVK